MLAKSIEGVTKQLGRALDRCVTENDRRGYFAALLWQATQHIATTMHGGVFQHPELVEKLHVTCANRYLSAVHSWDQRRSMSYAWQAAFRCAAGRNATVAQTVLASYQVHIGMDLGVALASTLARGELNEFRRDFQHYNEILDSLFTDRYGDLSKGWPLFQRLLKATGQDEAALIGFHGPNLREQAWEFARRLSLKDPDDRDELTDSRDAACAVECRSLASPVFPANALMALLHKTEKGTVPGIIGLFRRHPMATADKKLSGAA